MNDIIKIENHEGTPTVTSMQIAENFEKRHGDVLEAIDKLQTQIGSTENSAHPYFMVDSTINPQNNQAYRMYHLTRDGFSLLVMGFTGERALLWKLKYIEAFNQMEKAIYRPMTQAEILAGQAQLLVNMERKVTAIEQKVDNAIAAFTKPIEGSWRQDMNTTINKMCMDNGLSYSAFKGELYKELEQVAKCNLKSRQTNLKKRLANTGMKYAERQAISKIDVVERDPKLREIFEGIVRKVQTRYAGA